MLNKSFDLKCQENVKIITYSIAFSNIFITHPEMFAKKIRRIP